jgi:hypothetical protein
MTQCDGLFVRGLPDRRSEPDIRLSFRNYLLGLLPLSVICPCILVLVVTSGTALIARITRSRAYADTRDMLEVTRYVHHLRHHHRLLVGLAATAPSPDPLPREGERVLASSPSFSPSPPWGEGRGEGLLS